MGVNTANAGRMIEKISISETNRFTDAFTSCAEYCVSRINDLWNRSLSRDLKFFSPWKCIKFNNEEKSALALSPFPKP
jgi:hypothetical protein